MSVKHVNVDLNPEEVKYFFRNYGLPMSVPTRESSLLTEEQGMITIHSFY